MPTTFVSNEYFVTSLEATINLVYTYLESWCLEVRINTR